MIFAGIIAIIILEYAFRVYFLSRPFGFFEADYRAFPHFRLVENYRDAATTIVSHQRQVARQGGSRGARIALIGDSVTFGSELTDAETFAQQLQDKQSSFDVYNFGVPGYGLHEYLAVIKQLERDTFDWIVVTIVSNDPYPGSPGLYSLLSGPDQRVTHYYRYQGFGGRLKLLLFDNFKLLFYLGNRFRALWGNAAQAAEPAAACPEEQRRLEHSPEKQRFPTQQRIYADPTVKAEVKRLLQEMSATAARKSSKLLFVIHYDVFHYQGEETIYRSFYLDIFREIGAVFIDPFDLHQTKAADCSYSSGYFNGPTHPAANQAEVIAGLLASELERQTVNRTNP